MGTTEQKTAEVDALSSATHSNANTKTTEVAAAPSALAEAAVVSLSTPIAILQTTTPTPSEKKTAEDQAATVTVTAMSSSSTAEITVIENVGDEIETSQEKDNKTMQKQQQQLQQLEKQQQQQQNQQMQHQQLQINIESQLPRTIPEPLIIPATQASTLATNAAKKIRRAFSLPRNPFRWSRKFKTSAASMASSDSDYNNAGCGIRRDGGHNLAMSSCVGGGRGRSGSIITLGSNDGDFCNKDTNANVQTPTATVMHNGVGVGSGSGSGGGVDVQILRLTKVQEKTSGSNNNNPARILRRSSFRKFLNRIAQHLNASVNAGSGSGVGGIPKSTATSNKPTFIEIVPFYTGCWRRKESNKQQQATTTYFTNNTSTATGATTTERVPPIGGYQWPADQTPGVMGLKNHGNTCFMNAVLQCLSHTDILAEYFVLDQYKVDLKRRNKINSRKFGTKGELTEQLANVLKALWTCKNESDHSTSFKAVVDRYGSQFRSSTQHDAQEFLFWLLDKVHEDLNTATKRRYKSVKNNYGRPDEIIAAETLANHIRCNNSFVQAVFQAQFRSSLTCPRCKKQSNTFDPFHCISVQLPQLTQQTIFVTVVHMKPQPPRQVRMGLTVPAGSPIVALREQLQNDTGIASERMVLVDLNKDGFSRVFYDTQPVETLKGINTIYCIETPTENEDVATAQHTDESGGGGVKLNGETAKSSTTTAAMATTATTPKGNGAHNDDERKAATAASHATDLLLLVVNVHKKQHAKAASSQKDLTKDTETNESSAKPSEPEFENELFGVPFSMKAPRDCSYTELQKKLLRELSAQLKPEVFSYATPLTDMFQIRLQDPSADPVTYLEQVEHPLLTEMIDMALSVLSAEAGPPHIKLLLEWTAPEEHFIDMANNAAVVEHESVARLNASKPNDTASLTLEQCLEHYTKAETLSAEDAWRCPHCQQYLPVVKTLGLWSLPDILVVHFKRFRQHQEKGPQAAKLTTMVKFPLNAFDMSPHLAARALNGDSNATGLDTAASFANYRPSPWKKTRNGDSRSSTLNSRAEQKDTRYDLYAVCYHQGDTLETGHYTAACKNPYDRQWYKFDDQRVTKVPDDAIHEEIINNEAYMLFYQRRNVDAVECSGSSSNSGDHWVSRIVPPQPVLQAINKEKEPEKLETQRTSTQLLSEESDEQLEKERPQSKPVEIPNVNCEITEDSSTIAIVKESLLLEPEKPELVNIEELDFVDADISAEVNDLSSTKHNSLTKSAIANGLTQDNVELNNSVDAANQIFDMDEDCVTHIEPETITYNKLHIAEETKTISKSADESSLALPNATCAVHSVHTLNEGNLPPHDIKSHSASNTSTASSSTSSLSSGATPHSLAVSVHAASTLQSKFNGYGNAAMACHKSTGSAGGSGSHKEVKLSSSLKSHSGSINGNVHEFQLSRHHMHNNHQHHHHHQQQQQNNWHGSRSSVSAVENATQQRQHAAHGLNLRHSFSTSSNYKLRECSETISSLLRNSANTCSKDTLLFIDQQSHHHSRLIEDEDDTFMGRSLWISPVTPHKLITVSPKN